MERGFCWTFKGSTKDIGIAFVFGDLNRRRFRQTFVLVIPCGVNYSSRSRSLMGRRHILHILMMLLSKPVL